MVSKLLKNLFDFIDNVFGAYRFDYSKAFLVKRNQLILIFRKPN
jgi:hypothetical protein